MRSPLHLVFAASLLALPALLAACSDETLVEVPDPPPEPEPEPVVEPVAEDPPAEPEAPPTSGAECTSDSDCGDGSECESGTCVGVGVLQVTLTFAPNADYDLHVMTPSGEEIYFANPAAAGGLLDVDQCVVDCGDGATHVENVFFNGALESGTYYAWAVNYDGREGGAFTIEVSGAASAALNGFLDAYPEVQSEELSFTVP